MQQQPENRPASSDEIDITQFFRWIGRGFANLGRSVLFGIASLRNIFFNNRIFFGIIILIGLVLGALYSELLKKKFYKSTMVISCDYLNNQIVDNTIDKLNLLAQEREREGLAEVLNIDIATARNIQRFEYTTFVSEDDVVEMEVLRTQLNAVAADKKDLVEKVIDKLEIENKNAYRISVLVYNPDIVKPLEKALVNFFNTNNYIRKRIEINKTNLNNRRTKLIQESKKLDSLKRVMVMNLETLSKKPTGSNNVFLNEDVASNPLDVFQEDLRMNQEMLEIDRRLYIQPDFEVVDGFTTFKEPESASLAKIMIISFFMSILAGYLIIGAYRFDRLLASIPTSRAQA